MSTPDFDQAEKLLQETIVLLFRADAVLARISMGTEKFKQRSEEWDYLTYTIKKEGGL